MNSFILTDSGITVFLEDVSEAHTVSRDAKQFDDIVEAVTNDDFESVLKMINPAYAFKEFIYNSDHFTVEGGEFFFDGNKLYGHIASHLMKLVYEKIDISFMEIFLKNLYQNPSFRSISELYRFLESSSLPITKDGHFLAYKVVTHDWKDCHTNTIDNSIGQIPSMPRNEVNDDFRNECSRGLHFCSFKYLKSFDAMSGEKRVIVVKINPRDVVSIPLDYNNSKGRCCKYEVIKELNGYYKNSEQEHEKEIIETNYSDMDDEI